MNREMNQKSKARIQSIFLYLLTRFFVDAKLHFAISTLA